MSSSAALFLDAGQLYDLTHLKRKGDQIQWLRDNGFMVKPRADGTPLVSVAHVESILGAPLVTSLARSPTEPDWSTLDVPAAASSGKSKAP